MRLRPPIDPRNQETYRYLERHRGMLVQGDCRSAVPRPPALLTEEYGVLAQILAPVIVSGCVVGAVSVHQAGMTRDWSEADIGEVRRAVARLEAAIGSGPAGGRNLASSSPAGVTPGEPA